MDRFRRAIRFLLIFFVCLSMPNTAFCQSRLDRPLLRYIRKDYNTSPYPTHSLRWTTARWTVSSQYQQARKELEKGTMMEERIRRYRRDSMAEPKNAMRLYRRGYSLLRAGAASSLRGGEFWLQDDHLGQIGEVAWRMAEGEPCTDFEYVRVRYLASSILGEQKLLIPLGEKLMQIYRWGYALLLTHAKETRRGNVFWSRRGHREEVGELAWRMAEGAQVRDQEYIRVRYLISIALGYRRPLERVAQRLIKLYPQDPMLKLATLRALATSERKEDWDLALKEGLSWSQADPKNLQIIQLVGDLYLTRWLRLGKKAEDGQNAILWAERYLQACPPGATNASGAKKTIETLTKAIGTRQGS